MDLPKNLSVQAYCFRFFKEGGPGAIAKKVREIGLTKVEISTPPTRELFQPTIDAFGENGVDVDSTFAPAFANDEAKERMAFEFAALCGHKGMTVNFQLIPQVHKAFELAEKLSSEYGIRLGIHNHGCAHWLGSAQMLDYIFSQTSTNIGLCLDTAWAQDANINAVAAVKKYADRLVGLHFKDFVYDRSKNLKDVVIGTGNIDLPALLQALKEVNFNGYAALEYEGEPENPNPALIACREAIAANS